MHPPAQPSHDSLQFEESAEASLEELREEVRTLKIALHERDSALASAVAAQEELAEHVNHLKESLWRENAAVARTMAAMLAPNAKVSSPQTGVHPP